MFIWMVSCAIVGSQSQPVGYRAAVKDHSPGLQGRYPGRTTWFRWTSRLLLLGLFLGQLREHLLVLLDVLFRVGAELLPATVAADVVGLPLVRDRRDRRAVAHDAERPDLVARRHERLPLLGRADAVDLARQRPALGLDLEVIEVAVVVEQRQH